MSTILDALKKSEQERKLNDIPTLSDMPAPQETSRWPMIVIAVFLFLLLVLVGVLLSKWVASNGSPEVSVITNNDALIENQQGDILLADNTTVVSVVSFSEDAAQRFAIINGSLFRENDYVQAGLKVESILEDSVVLIERGKRINLKP